MSEHRFNLRSDLPAILGGALTMAAFSTLGDWIWANYLRDGDPVAGVVHGLLIFIILAAAIAAAIGTRLAYRRLLPTMPCIGFLLAAVFYPLAYVTGYIAALLVTWILMWLLTAALTRWAAENDETLARAMQRGGAAALFSGLAFWAISGIWTQPSPGGPNYLWHFCAWTIAFLPGFVALLFGRKKI